ncbi:DUF427 domain-containing protein [Streptomyces sp. MC1]|uniref:DUF427 domain-containing protein n=1 Tax=unclassified Streptomyces TaxID=2593676 RepID=UPI0004C58B42|nr:MULTISPECIES: DUF427 domain-containing protein [unclassified Streptomyces]KOV98015.1 hypothetical protein ADL02_06830 [Streptomyces sp. NRRL WC-3723]MBG7697578.1 DUF427 domain-containing protein [Streptomyces sp. MC1]
MKATVDGHVLAEAPDEETIVIEGNVYFPPSAVKHGLLSESDTEYVCPWKGHSQYFDATISGKRVSDVAWSYPDLLADAIEIVGQDFSGYIAFSPRVDVGRG